jgi:hypothetical protein
MRFTRKRGAGRTTRVLRDFGLYNQPSMSKLQTINDFLKDPARNLVELGFYKLKYDKSTNTKSFEVIPKYEALIDLIFTSLQKVTTKMLLDKLTAQQNKIIVPLEKQNY